MTQPSESEPVEPGPIVEYVVEPVVVVDPELDVADVVEPKENQDKQLSMIPCTYLI